MKMAKATEKDIDAAGDAMSVLQDISSGYYPKRDGDECDDFHFDPEDPAHLRKFYDLMSATLDASPGWPGRVIGGMCYVIMYDANRIVDPDSDTLDLHPRFEAMSGETHSQREEVCAAWADLPDDLRKDPRLTRLYHALGGHRMDDPSEAEPSASGAIHNSASPVNGEATPASSEPDEKTSAGLSRLNGGQE